MLKERQVEALDSWLKRAKACQVTELSSFVNGIRRDYAAVEAAFRLPWNNGIVEGHVKRLKFLKRQMFGRAHLDLLCVKVLHALSRWVSSGIHQMCEKDPVLLKKVIKWL